jgi:hypothetical protein
VGTGVYLPGLSVSLQRSNKPFYDILSDPYLNTYHSTVIKARAGIVKLLLRPFNLFNLYLFLLVSFVYPKHAFDVAPALPGASAVFQSCFDFRSRPKFILSFQFILCRPVHIRASVRRLYWVGGRADDSQRYSSCYPAFRATL